MAAIGDHDQIAAPVVLAAAQGGMRQWAWPRIAAVYVIVVTPGIIAFAQRLFFKGLMACSRPDPPRPGTHESFALQLDESPPCAW